MKIAIWYHLPSGGAKRMLYDYVKALAGRGHNLEIWCPSTSDTRYLPLDKLAPEHVIPYGGGLNAIREMDKISRECAEEINRSGFDLLLACSCQLTAAPFIGRYVRIPKVLYLQEPNRRFYEARPILPWIEEGHTIQSTWFQRIFQAFKYTLRFHMMRKQAKEEWLNARSYDLILVNSYFSRENVRRVYDVDSTVCYPGIDPFLFFPGLSNKEPFIVGLGAFVPHKGIDFALESVARCSEPRPRLVWIGDQGDRNYMRMLEHKARSLGVDLEMRFKVSDQELVGLLGRASLLFYPPYLEPFGLAVLEANACETPVVAVAEGGIRETVQDGVNGFLINRNPLQAARRIEELLANPTLIEALGRNGHRLVQENWNLNDSIDRLEHILECVRSGYFEHHSSFTGSTHSYLGENL